MRTYRKCTELQSAHSELATDSEWKTLLAALKLAMQNTRARSIHRMLQMKTNIGKAANIQLSYREPLMFRERAEQQSEPKKLNKAPAVIHYQFCCFWINQAESFADRLKQEDITRSAELQQECVGATPPDENIEANDPEAFAPTHTNDTGKTTTPPYIISRKQKQQKQDFIEMLSKGDCAGRGLPYSVFQGHTEQLKADTLQDIRHLALIDLKGCKYQQLPLSNRKLFSVLEKQAQHTKHNLETEVEYIEAAQKRLHEFAIDPDNAYAGIRFLGLHQHDATAVHAATDKIINDYVKLMQDNDLGHMWSSWHPHRFVAVATYVYLFVVASKYSTSRWQWMLQPERIYIPIDDIQSLPKLASHCPPSAEMLGVECEASLGRLRMSSIGM